MSRSKLKYWAAWLKFFSFLHKLGRHATYMALAHTCSCLIEETVCKERLAIFRPIGHINCYGLIFTHYDCSFKNLSLYTEDLKKIRNKRQTHL